MKNILSYLFIITCLFWQSAFCEGIIRQKKLNLQFALNNLLREGKDKYQVNGMQLAVILPGVRKPEVFNIGTTKIGNNVSVSNNYVFQVGSITKTFTAALIAKAIMQGKLKLNDRIGYFLPHIYKWKDITIGQLVNQTSGIFDYDKTESWWPNLINYPEKLWSAGSLIKLAYSQQDNFKPGEGWSYSNTNYILLGEILKIVYHQPPKALVNNLIQQTGLKNTYYLPMSFPKGISKKMVHGYYANQYDQTQINTSWLKTAGGIISNSHDIAIWYRWLFNNSDVKNQMNFKSTKTGQLAKNIMVTGYSFGIFRLNTPEGLVYFTPGLTPGYISLVAYAPCINTYFAYSIAKAPIPKIHEYMMTKILKILKEYELKIDENKLPNYCRKLKPATKFIFPNI